MRLLIEQDLLPLLLARPGCSLRYRYTHHALIECVDLPPDLPRDGWRRVDAESFFVNGVLTHLADDEFDVGVEPHTLLKFIGPVDAMWLQQLKSRGVILRFNCPPCAWCVRLPEELRVVDLARAFPFVCAAAPYREGHCSRGLPHERDKMQRGGLPHDACDLVFFSREDKARIVEELAANGVTLLDSSAYKVRVRYNESLRDLRDLHGVKLADYSRATQLCAQEDLYTAVARPVAEQAGDELRGRGQVIAVADTGLDTGLNDDSLHADFQGRVRAITSWPLNSSWHEFASQSQINDGAADRASGHGTHVAGLALGSGARSAGLHQGVAPQAELVFQAIEQYVDVKREYRGQLKSGYYLSGRPLDLCDLFEQAREFGARIHVNAWGDEAHGQYTDDCYEADRFLVKHADAVVLFAAGNSGADRDGNRVLDKQSLYAPASAKNVIAIGATEGGMADIGLRVNWSAFDTNNSRFLSSVDRTDAVSGQAECIALFSSAGPSADGRIKPDVCAPGTNLVAPRSQSTAGKGWGLASPLPYYMYNGGTSMAAGVAGGAVAILREAWENERGQAPSGPALKALLILSSVPVRSRRDDATEPRHVGGFGRLQIAQALPKSSETKITVYDERERGLTTGDVRDYPLLLSRSGALRAVLCWYDAPGEVLINNLDLCLIDALGNRVWGNHGPGERGQPDAINTVEAINIDSLAAGRYVLRVIAANVAIGPQAYALVVRQPINGGPNIPLEFVLGIGTRLAERCAAQGLATVGALLSRPQALSQVSGLSAALRAQILARLQVIAQVRELIAPDNELGTTSLNQLLNGRKPSRFSDAVWQTQKERCAPLVLVFNKRALSKISLQVLCD